MHKITAARHRTEETTKRSRFIATVAHVTTKKEVKAFLSDIKNEFPDATHNCWVYVADAPGDTPRVGMSDDGEPHGTVGKPMLSVLLQREIGGIAVVVTRYFGGTKLGKGGLVRAYANAVQNDLVGLRVKEKRDVVSLTAILDYSNIAAVKQMVEAIDGEIVAERFAADVTFTIGLPKERKDGFVRAVTDVTGGEIRITR